MGHIAYKSSADWAGLAVRSGIAPVLSLALLVGMALGSMPVRAESSSAGLIISRNGDHVNVSVDSNAGSAVSIRRSDDVMVIKLPSSFGAKVVIDPRLTQDRVVQETEVPSGKIIAINAQQINLMTQENLKDNVPSGSTKPATPAASRLVPPSSAKSVVSNIKKLETAVQSVIQASASPSAPASIPTPHPAPMKPASTMSLAAIPSIVPREKTGQKAPSAANKHLADKQAANLSLIPPKPKTTASVKPATPTRNPFTEPVDPEAQPLDLSGQPQAAASRVASYTLFRIVISLLAVLGMLLGFMRMLLPKLMERYPAFFERLRQRQESATASRGPRAGGRTKVTRQPEPDAPSAVSMPVQPGTEATAVVHWLQDNQLTVLGSTPLGDGKEIHLVEVRGKQLVIATTPSTVSLLTDLTDALAEDEADDLFLSGMEANSEPPVIAYLSDESPVIAQPVEPAQPAKPYASTPSDVQPATVSPPAAPPRTPVDRTYRKYLQPQQSVPKDAYQDAYVDAEDVIVLEDYDDVYGF
jgi:flagellar biogenesis protein FliO